MECDTRFTLRLAGLLEDEDLARGTVEITVTACRQFEEFLRGSTGEVLDPDDVRVVAVDVAEWRSYMTHRGLKSGTVQRKLMGLRLGLRLVCPTLVASLRWPKVRLERLTAPSGFSRTERNSILRACDQMSPRDAAIVKLLLFTGARSSSVATARLSGLHVGARSGSITYVGKGSKTYRVPLNVEAREALRAYLEVRPAAEHDFVFCAERAPHDPISRGVVWATWHSLRRHVPAALAEKVRGGHQARHDLARRLLSGDEGTKVPVPLGDVAAIMAHADVRTTAGIYARPSEESLARALERIVGEGD
jgi:integrase/recombinase XerC